MKMETRILTGGEYKWAVVNAVFSSTLISTPLTSCVLRGYVTMFRPNQEILSLGDFLPLSSQFCSFWALWDGKLGRLMSANWLVSTEHWCRRFVQKSGSWGRGRDPPEMVLNTEKHAYSRQSWLRGLAVALSPPGELGWGRTANSSKHKVSFDSSTWEIFQPYCLTCGGALAGHLFKVGFLKCS